jgi:hypothetical protein
MQIHCPEPSFVEDCQTEKMLRMHFEMRALDKKRSWVSSKKIQYQLLAWPYNFLGLQDRDVRKNCVKHKVKLQALVTNCLVSLKIKGEKLMINITVKAQVLEILHFIGDYR